MARAADTDGQVIASSLTQPERFEAIFDRHARSIYRYLRRRVGEQLAEELTADTFTSAFRGRARFDTGQVSALPWLYGIAVNHIRMHLRSDRRRQRAYGRAPRVAVQPPATAEAEARLDARAQGPALSAALAALSSDEREVLLLHAWAELSPAEIAQALGVSSATVRTRLHRARIHAAGALGDPASEHHDLVCETP